MLKKLLLIASVVFGLYIESQIPRGPENLAIPWAAIAGIASGLGGLIGGNRDNQRYKWDQGAFVNLLNRLDEAYNYGRSTWQDALLPGALGAIWPTQANGSAILTEDGQLGGDLNFLLRNAITNQESPYSPTNILSQWGRPYENGRMGIFTGDAYNLFNPNGSQMDAIRQLSGQAFQGGGWTPARQSFLETINPLLSGQNPQMGEMSNVGGEILRNRGGNQFTLGIMDMANQVLRQGGETDWLRGLIQNAAGIAEQGGATPFTRGGQGFAGSILQQDGRTPFSGAGALAGLQGVLGGGNSAVNNTLADRGLELLDREPLISPQQALSFAADQAGTDTQRAFQAAQSRALARGGGPGSVVAAGQANAGMGEFADAAARNKAEAMREALIRQQELGLRQQGLGAETLQAAGGQQNQLLGTYSDLLSAMEGQSTNRLGLGFSGLGQLGGLENQRLLGALGLVPDAQNSANQRASIFGNLGLGSDSQNIQRLGIGGNFLNNFTQNQLSALQALTGHSSAQDQYTLGMGGLFNNLGNSQANVLNQLYQNELNSMNAGLNRANLAGNLWQNTIGNAQNNLNMWNNNVMNSWNPLVSLAGQGQNWGLTALGGLGLGGAPNLRGQQGGGGFGGALGSLIGGLGGFGGNNGG